MPEMQCWPQAGIPADRVDRPAWMRGYRRIRLRFDGSWFIDVAELEQLLDGRAARIRALVLINPNNPTGSYVKPAERERVVTMCRSEASPLLPMKCSLIMPLSHLPATRVWPESRCAYFCA